MTVTPRKAHREPWLLPAFGLYVAVLGFTTYCHESWFDEAQAWLLARDLDVFRLWFVYLRYEGTPGLWHSMLAIPAKLGLPYGAMHLIANVAAGVAAALVLWRAPFPWIVRALLPFTYFLIYQYAVIARSYTLFPAIFFLTALFLPQARHRTYVFMLLLIVMANISLHGTLAATGILAAYLVELWRDRNQLSQAEILRHALACGGFVVALMLLAAQLWPPNDLWIFRAPGSLGLRRSAVVAVITQTSEALSIQYPKIAQVESMIGWSKGAHAAKALAFLILGMGPSGLVLALSMYWFYKMRTLLYFVLPAGAVLLLSSLVYHNVWHAGVLFLIWLFAMWLTTNRSQASTPAYICLAWILVLATQLYASAATIAFDIANPYSGSREVARYLKSEGLSDRVVFAAGHESMSVQPYFTKNVFRNYHNGDKPAFWIWRTSNDFPEVMSSIPPSRPDVLVLSLRTNAQRAAVDELVRSLPQTEYVVAGRFEGKLYWKTSVMETESFLLIRKAGKSGLHQQNARH